MRHPRCLGLDGDGLSRGAAGAGRRTRRPDAPGRLGARARAPAHAGAPAGSRRAEQQDLRQPSARPAPRGTRPVLPSGHPASPVRGVPRACTRPAVVNTWRRDKTGRSGAVPAAAPRRTDTAPASVSDPQVEERAARHRPRRLRRHRFERPLRGGGGGLDRPGGGGVARRLRRGGPVYRRREGRKGMRRDHAQDRRTQIRTEDECSAVPGAAFAAACGGNGADEHRRNDAARRR